MDNIAMLEDLTRRLNQPKGEWDWNIETNELLWSTAVFRMFGLTPSTFGSTYDAFLDSVHEDDRESVKAAVDKALQGEEYSIDHRIVLPNGTIRTVHEVAEVFFDEHGKAIRMTGTVRDITEFGRNSEAEWRKYILDEFKELRKDQGLAAVQIGKLQVKAGVWGAMGGLIPATGVILFMLVRGG